MTNRRKPGSHRNGKAFSERVREGVMTMKKALCVVVVTMLVMTLLAVSGAAQKSRQRPVGVSSARSKGGQVALVTRDVPLGKVLPGAFATSIVVSPDSRRLAYVAARGIKQVVVVDGKPGKEYDGILFGPPVFSPDSQQVAYVAKRGDRWLAVIEGGPARAAREGKEYDEVRGVLFSPDSQRLAHVASKGGKLVVVVRRANGTEREGDQYDDIGAQDGDPALHFSPDSRRLAFVALHEDKWKVVVTGDTPQVRREGASYDAILQGTTRFSPDSQRLAYVAKRGDRQLVVVADVGAGRPPVEGKEYDGILEGSLAFSPDSKRLAYFGERGDQRLAVVDGAEGKAYDEVSKSARLLFSPNSQRIAYLAYRGGKPLLVVDDKEGTAHEDMDQQAPLFSPDGKRLAYVSKREGKWLVVLDGLTGGTEGKAFDGIQRGTLTFSPDSQRVAFVARRFGLAVGPEEGTGTAFVVHTDGYLLTCAHVVQEAAKIEVKLGGKTYDATVQRLDWRRDLALLKIGATDLPALPLAPSSMATLGQDVWVFGFPLGNESVRVSRGAIAGIDRRNPERGIEVDAAVNPGNSGGPLINEKGEVVGIVSAKFLNVMVSGVGAAIPSDFAQPLLREEKLESAKEPAKAKLDGVELAKRVAPAVARVCVRAPIGGTQRVVADGREGKEYDEIGAFAFSPDSRRVAYSARRGDKFWIVVDGREGKQYDLICDLVFSPDSRRVVYEAVRDGKFRVVVDGTEGRAYDCFVMGSKFVFDSPTQFHTLAGRSGEFIRVEVKMGEK